MLCDQLMVDLADGSGCDIRPILPRLQRAQKFVLGAEFAAVAESLADDFTGLVRIFSMCRLPYPDVWFEVTHADRPRFMGAEMHAPQVQMRPKKVGFLLTATREDLSAWKAHLFWSMEGHGCSTCLLATIYDMTHPINYYTEIGPDAIEHRQDQDIGPIHIKKFENHPGWDGADRATKLLLANHTDLALGDCRYTKEIIQQVPPGRMDEFIRLARTLARADWAGECAYLLAVVGLMNTRNAIEATSADLTRLNRARVRNDKRQLFEHKILKIAGRVHKKVYPDGAAGIKDHAPMRGHFVRSHWKKRKTGIFFWHPFARGHFDKGSITKDYLVK